MPRARTTPRTTPAASEPTPSPVDDEQSRGSRSRASQHITDARAEFRRATDEASPALAALWLEVLTGADKEFNHDVVCKCGLRHRKTFKMPDLVARAKAGEMLMNHGWGRPAQVEPERDLGEAVGKDASDLTADERAAILAAVRKRLEE